MNATPTLNNPVLSLNIFFSTLAEALDYASKGQTGYNFYSSQGKLSTVLPYATLREEARSLAKKLTNMEVGHGSRVALVADMNPDFVRFFFACQYAGLILWKWPPPKSWSSAVDRRFEWNYLNPFLPYYWEQLNESANDNPLWNLELSWRARPGLRLFGEWLIDDFQIDFESEPQQIGVLIGGLWSPAPLRGRLSLNAEYQRINTYVYGQGQPWNRYFHHRDNDGAVIGIGSNLGTDADRISIQPLCHLSPCLDLRGDFHYIRRGANRISDPQKSCVPKGTPSPSGTVEREWRLAIGPRWQQGGHLVAWALVGFDDVDNVAHVDGARRSGWFVQLRVNALWWKTFGV